MIVQNSRFIRQGNSTFVNSISNYNIDQGFLNCGTRTPWGYSKFFKDYESGQQTFKLK